MPKGIQVVNRDGSTVVIPDVMFFFLHESSFFPNTHFFQFFFGYIRYVHFSPFFVVVVVVEASNGVVTEQEHHEITKKKNREKQSQLVTFPVYIQICSKITIV